FADQFAEIVLGMNGNIVHFEYDIHFLKSGFGGGGIGGDIEEKDAGFFREAGGGNFGGGGDGFYFGAKPGSENVFRGGGLVIGNRFRRGDFGLGGEFAEGV